MRNIRLWWQLKRSGTSRADRAAMMAVAKKLQHDNTHLSRHAKDAIAEQIGFKPVHVRFHHRLQTAGAAVAFVAVIIVAQFAHPGSPLYALKRGTQHVRAIIQPSYKHELEQEQEQQEKETEQHQSQERTEGSHKESTEQKSGDDHSGTSGSSDDSHGGTSGTSGSNSGSSHDGSNSGSDSSGSGSNSGSSDGSSSNSGSGSSNTSGSNSSSSGGSSDSGGHSLDDH